MSYIIITKTVEEVIEIIDKKKSLIDKDQDHKFWLVKESGNLVKKTL